MNIPRLTKRKFVVMSTISVLLLLQASVYGSIIYNDIKAVKEQSAVRMENVYDSTWGGVTSVLDEVMGAKEDENSQIKGDLKALLQGEFDPEALDTAITETDLDSRVVTLVSEYMEQQDYDDVMLLVSKGWEDKTDNLEGHILYDNDLHRSSDSGTLRTIATEIARQENSDLAKLTFCAILSQRPSQLYWQPSVTNAKLEKISMEYLKDMVEQNGFESLKGVKFMEVAYIEDSESIGGRPDTIFGQRTNSPKLIILNSMDLYEYIKESHPVIFNNYSANITDIQQDTSSYIRYKSNLLFITVILTLIVLTACVSLQNLMVKDHMD